MNRNRAFHFLYFLILLLSTILRINLAIVNRDANDDHLFVARLIMQEKRLPGMNECWECFQPKLFHYLLSIIFQILGIEIKDVEFQIILTQLLNVFMGIVFILIVWVFLNSLTFENELLKIMAFSLVAFNPDLIGINAQATNDTLAILLGTLAIYAAWIFLKQERSIYLLASIIFVSLGITTKSNIFITAVGIQLALLVKAFTKKQRFIFFRAALFLPGVLVILFLNPISQYLSNYRNFGSVVGMNMEEQPIPDLFEKSYVARPGIVSIQDGFFTFKYVGLLEYPRLTNGFEGYPAHRTSLWTQIYARANSVHFANWPVSWGAKGNENFTLTRAIFIFALLPVAMLLIGAVISLTDFLITLMRRSIDSLQIMDYGLFDVVFWSYVGFIILYSLKYRDFSVMKAIFIYPAMLSFPLFFIKSGMAIRRVLMDQKLFMTILSVVVTVLIILYSLDVYTLIVHLNSL